MILVTGATGILGSHVVFSLLRRGKNVVAIERSSGDITSLNRLFALYGEGALAEKIVWREGDIGDVFSIENALEGVEEVYHCAGFVSFNPKDRKKLFAVNETGTRNMVNACLHRGVHSLCFASSLATIRNPDSGDVIDEQVFWKSSGRESDYAISKYNAEREVWRGIEEGLPAVIVNPGVLLAPGFWNQSSSRLFVKCSKGNLFYTAGTTGYIGAADAAEIMVTLMERRRYGERFILIEGNYSYRDILTGVQSCFNLPPPKIKAGRFSLWVGRKALSALAFFTGKDPEITRFVIKSLLNRKMYDNRKVLSAVDFTLKPVPELIHQICRQYALETANGAATAV